MLQDVRLLYGIGDSLTDTGEGPMTSLKNRSTRMPRIGDISVIDMFLDAVLRDLDQLKTRSANNCTLSELEDIKSLEEDPQIVIKPLTKGGTQ